MVVNLLSEPASVNTHWISGKGETKLNGIWWFISRLITYEIYDG
jgi:hypothetical protein